MSQRSIKLLLLVLMFAVVAGVAFLFGRLSRRGSEAVADAPAASPVRAMPARSANDPTNVPIGVVVGDYTDRYDVAETGYASNLVVRAVEAAVGSLADATNAAIRSKAMIDEAIAMTFPPAASGVRLHVYGQEDYDLAETSFVTNFAKASVVGAVTNLVNAINSARARRSSLIDQYIMSRRDLIADYTWLQEIEILPGHTHMETQIPLGIEIPIVSSNALLWSGYDYSRPNVWTNTAVSPAVVVTNYPTVPWRMYFRVTNDVSDVEVPFSVAGRYVVTNDPAFYSRPNLFFYPKEAGIYRVVAVDVGGGGPYAGYDGLQDIGAIVTVTKAEYDEFTGLDHSAPNIPMPSESAGEGRHWERTVSYANGRNSPYYMWVSVADD